MVRLEAKPAILQNIKNVEKLTEFGKQTRELKVKLGLEEGKSYSKEDPSEVELDALYKKIRKTIS